MTDTGFEAEWAELCSGAEGSITERLDNGGYQVILATRESIREAQWALLQRLNRRQGTRYIPRKEASDA